MKEEEEFYELAKGDKVEKDEVFEDGYMRGEGEELCA